MPTLSRESHEDCWWTLLYTANISPFQFLCENHHQTPTRCRHTVCSPPYTVDHSICVLEYEGGAMPEQMSGDPTSEYLGGAHV